MANSMLIIDGLEMRFGGLLAVDKVQFSLASGQIGAIIGPNGAGKTTVFNCISGFYRPSAGKILFAGEDITGLSSQAIGRRGLTRTFQNIRLFKEMTAIENLLVGAHCHLNRSYWAGIWKTRAFRSSENLALAQGWRWLEFFNLQDCANKEAGALAYGQQRYLEIARAMMTRPKLLILDEPAAGLNPQETRQLGQLIQRLRSEHGLTVLLIEHDMNLVMAISEKILVMEYGRPIATGTPAEIRSNPAVVRAYLGEE